MGVPLNSRGIAAMAAREEQDRPSARLHILEVRSERYCGNVQKWCVELETRLAEAAEESRAAAGQQDEHMARLEGALDGLLARLKDTFSCEEPSLPMVQEGAPPPEAALATAAEEPATLGDNVIADMPDNRGSQQRLDTGGAAALAAIAPGGVASPRSTSAPVTSGAALVSGAPPMRPHSVSMSSLLRGSSDAIGQIGTRSGLALAGQSLATPSTPGQRLASPGTASHADIPGTASHAAASSASPQRVASAPGRPR